MSFPVRITYRGLEPSESLNRLIREEAAKLEKFFDGIVGCRLLVERQYGHHHAGSPYHVRLNVVVPGSDLAIVTEPSDDVAPPGNETLQRAAIVRDTFRRARRRLREYARRKSGPHVRTGLNKKGAARRARP
jgi:hypothetical protein